MSRSKDQLPAPVRRGLSREEAAAYLSVSPNTFDRLVEDRAMPQPVQLLGRKVWDLRAVDAAFDRLASPGALQAGPAKRQAASWS